MEQREWVRRLQAGEDDAWREFVRTFSYFAPIVANRLGLPASDQEEILQDMTVTALRSIQNLRDPSRLGSWTFTIAYRAAINIRKSQTGGTWAFAQDETCIASIPSDEIPIDEALAAQEDVRRLRDAMLELSDLCRRILEGLYLREPRLTYKQLSESFGMPIGSIGPNLARCLKKLRQAIRSVSDPGSREPAGRETGTQTEGSER